MSIAAIVTSIPPRAAFLAEALRSVTAQTRQPDEIITVIDRYRRGAAAQRNWAVTKTNAHWLAFLDDDDIWYPNHLDILLNAALHTDADVVYSWFHLVDEHNEPVRDPLTIGTEPAFGHPFDADARQHLLNVANFIPVTALVRTEAFRAVGGFPRPGTYAWSYPDCEDWGLWQAMAHNGAKFHHVPERTWEWRWHESQTSGQTDRW